MIKLPFPRSSTPACSTIVLPMIELAPNRETWGSVISEIYYKNNQLQSKCQLKFCLLFIISSYLLLTSSYVSQFNLSFVRSIFRTSIMQHIIIPHKLIRTNYCLTSGTNSRAINNYIAEVSYMSDLGDVFTEQMLRCDLFQGKRSSNLSIS